MTQAIWGRPETYPTAPQPTQQALPVDAEVQQRIDVMVTAIWNMILDTYGDNLAERASDGAIVYQSQWEKDVKAMLHKWLEEFAKESQ